MNLLEIDQKQLESMNSRLAQKGIHLSEGEVDEVVGLIKDEILYGYVKRLITQAESILDIDPTFHGKGDPPSRSEDHRGQAGANH